MMTQEIEHYASRLDTVLSKSPGPAEREKLFKLHVQLLSDFQHERLIHLFVTLFFGVLTVGSYVLLVYTFGVAAFFAGLLAALLTALEGGYVIHYYRLENSIQKLYTYTEKLAK